MKRAAIFCTIALALGYAAALTGLWAKQDTLIFPATINTLPYTPQPATHDYAVLNLTLPDGTLQQVVQTPRRVPLGPSLTLVVAFGGNAHDVGGMVIWLRQHVWPSHTVVMGAPYRGYPSAFMPRQPGVPTQQAVLADAAYLTHWAQNTYKPAQTVLVGYSLGSSVAAHTALNVPISASILITPFTSMGAMATAQYPWLFAPLVNRLLRHPFPTAQWLAEGTSPVALIGAERDGLIPPHHLPTLAEASQGPVVLNKILPGVTHGGALDAPKLPALLQQVIQP